MPRHFYFWEITMRHQSRRSTFLWRLLLLAICLKSAGTFAAAAKEVRQKDITEVVVIEVPVQVTYGGEPARGLTPDQFEVFDGRKRRELTGFDVYDLSGSAIEEGPMGSRIPAAAQRKFLFFFDLSFSDPDSILRARDAAKQFVNEGLAPTDLVGVATFSATEGSKMIVGFTSDRRQVEIAVETLGMPQLVKIGNDPLKIRLTPLAETWEMSTPDPTLADNRPEDIYGSPTGKSLRQWIRELQASIQLADESRVIRAFGDSLSQVAEMMQAVEGRKYLVLLSQGFEASVVVGQGGSSREAQRAIQRQNAAAIRGDYAEVDSNLRFGDTSTQNELSRVLRELVQADCVIEAVDIGGLGAEYEAEDQKRRKQGLFMLARDTGGELFENYNNLSEAMTQMLERTSVTYVLAFHAENLKLDGKFHKLQVLLEGRPDGYRVVHRPGYFAPRPYSEISAKERNLTAASRLYGEPGGELKVGTLAASFEVSSERAYVPSLIEVDGPDLLRGSQDGKVTAEIFAYAIAANGEVRDYYNQILGIDLEKAGPSLEQKGLKFWSEFDLPPGEYLARVLVRNAVTGDSGVAVSPFRVPDAGMAEPTLLAPLFPEPAGLWLNVRGQRALESEQDYPFTVQGQAFEPSVKPRLTPEKSAAVLLSGYDLGDHVEIRGELLTLKGEPAGRVFLNLGERRLDSDSGLAQWAATLSVSDLDPGDYVLRVIATDPETGESFSSSISVKLSG